MDYVLHVIVLATIYATLSASLDLLAGRTGLVSVAHASFYGLGAYSSALVALHAGLPFLVGILLGMLTAVIASFAVSLSSIHLHEDYFVIGTLAFQGIMYAAFNNLIGLTGGPLGISGIPRPVLFGWRLQSTLGFALAGCALAISAYAIVDRIAASPFGRVLLAIREDEVFAEALGKRTLRTKVAVFAVSSALAATAGSLYAHYSTYIDPNNFGVTESILIISMVIVGGAGSRWGPVLGAMSLIALGEVVRFMGLPNDVAASARQMVYGALLLMVMIIRPRGIAGVYGFGR